MAFIGKDLKCSCGDVDEVHAIFLLCLYGNVVQPQDIVCDEAGFADPE
jgi:hypothetical protein